MNAYDYNREKYRQENLRDPGDLTDKVDYWRKRLDQANALADGLRADGNSSPADAIQDAINDYILPELKLAQNAVEQHEMDYGI